uniref:ING domain-containing protein n=1 Tax=Parastrongyloides trichosuri TaxID=131310 RepID=A0A0N4ZRT3_PARTI
MADEVINTQKVLLEERSTLCNYDTLCDTLLKQFFELYSSKNYERFCEVMSNIEDLMEKRKKERYEELIFRKNFLNIMRKKNIKLEKEVQELRKKIREKSIKYQNISVSKEDEQSISKLIEKIKKLRTKKELEIETERVYEAINFYDGETQRLEKETASYDNSINSVMDIIGRYDKCVVRTSEYLDCLVENSNTEPVHVVQQFPTNDSINENVIQSEIKVDE